MTLYFFWGKEEFNIDARVGELRKRFVNPAFQAMSYKIFNNPSFSELIEAVSTQPFMFGGCLSVIHCNKYFLAGKKEVELDDNELKRLEEAFESLSESVQIALVCKIPRDENKKVDTRKKLYKIIAKHAQVSEFPEYRSYDKELVNWIRKQAKEKEITISDNNAKLLVGTVGVNLRNLDSELEKLKLFKHPSKEISEADIKTVCNETQDIFKVIDFYVEGKRDLAVEELRKLHDKQHYLQTLATLHTNLRSSILMKIDSATMSPYEISQKLRLHEYVIKLRLEKLQKVSLESLVTLKQNLTKAETEIKTGKLSYHTALELAFLNDAVGNCPPYRGLTT